MSDEGMSRRELFKRGGELGTLLALPALLHADTASAAPAAAPGSAGAGAFDPTSVAEAAVNGSTADVYKAVGVRPLINGRGTYTVIGGSMMLPEVRVAMAAASQHFVQLDELADGIGKKLAELTGAEFGLVTNGCSAAITHATAACVAGGNPDLHVRLPNLAGFQKDEVVIPNHSRNVYDAAVRAVGVRVIEVSTVAELQAALGPRTAMIYILASPRADKSELNTKAIADVAKTRNVPVFVDAAAEELKVPNIHLAAGATLVGYSGGKCLRGPQAGGILLGRKDLVRAAWVHSAPHHGYSRALKVGREEAIGIVTAVEMWLKRDHDAEYKMWQGWLDTIAKRVSAVPTVATNVIEPDSLSNHMPTLRIVWDRAKVGIDGNAVAKILLDGEPRVTLFPGRGDTPAQSGVSVGPYMMAAGDEKIIADKLFAVLSAPPKQEAEAPPVAPTGDLTGQWDVQVTYAAGQSKHALYLRQKGNDVDGAHKGDFVTRDLNGTISGDTVRLRSNLDESHGDALNFTFTGKLSGDQIAGTLDMGEYLTATWTATRHTRGGRA
jgi:L-seryl-tRNA(Ser) seleniumtransferase